MDSCFEAKAAELEALPPRPIRLKCGHDGAVAQMSGISDTGHRTNFVDAVHRSVVALTPPPKPVAARARPDGEAVDPDREAPFEDFRGRSSWCWSCG